MAATTKFPSYVYKCTYTYVHKHNYTVFKCMYIRMPIVDTTSRVYVTGFAKTVPIDTTTEIQFMA